ncbi:MAG: PP2C family protein-serine/threonine phosphatase [Pseudomonadales bacterium]
MQTHLFLNADTNTTTELQLPGHQISCFCKPVSAAGVNQDSAGVIELSDDRCVLIVADGMGGGLSGDKASNLAVTAIAEQVGAAEVEGAPLRAGILNGFEHAQATISSSLSGAATTLLVVEIQGNQARTYHVGDSEACVFGQRGKLKAQTGSHSPVGYAVRSGLLDETEALHHEDRHYVSNMIGLEDMSVEMGLPFALAAKDTLVLASDGLFDNLALVEIIETARVGPLHQAVSALAERALQRMAAADSAADSMLPSKPDDLAILAHRLH